LTQIVLFSEMLKFSEILFLKENEDYFEIFEDYSILEIKIFKIN
jgi:hypothetical protein